MMPDNVEAQLGDTPDRTEKACFATRAKLFALQEQNEQILEHLSRLCGPNFLGDSPSGLSLKPSCPQTVAMPAALGVGGADEELPHPPKKTKTAEISSHCSTLDVDEQVDLLVNEPGLSDTSDSQSEFAAELVHLAQDYEKEEESGPKVSDNLASLVNVMLKGAISEDKLEQKFSQHKRPKSCNLFVLQVNGKFWEIMDHSAKTNDLHTQHIQKTLLKAVCAITVLTENCLASKDSGAKTSCKGMLDMIGLVLKANRDLS